MNRVYIATLVLLAYGCAGKQISPERRRDLAALQFKHYVEVAGKGMDIYPPPVIHLTDDILDVDEEDIPMAIYQMPVVRMPYYTAPQFVIHVRNAYLDDHPIGGLEHGATHEICHAKLGHLDRDDDDDAEESEAELCAYHFLGEEIYVTFMKNHAVWHARKTGNYKDLAAMSEKDLARLIRIALGIDEL